MPTNDSRRPYRMVRSIRTVPTFKPPEHAEFRAYDKWSKELLRELARLGYTINSWGYTEPPDPVGSHIYLTDVGRSGLTIVLRAVTSGLDGIRIERVAVGRESFTARQAALWLRKRASRVKR